MPAACGARLSRHVGHALACIRGPNRLCSNSSAYNALIHRRQIPFYSEQSRFRSSRGGSRLQHTPPSTVATHHVVESFNVAGREFSPPLSPAHFNDLIKYGEFCQLTMDGVDLNEWSRYRGQIKYDEAKLLDDSDGHLSRTSAFQWLPEACAPSPDGVPGYQAVAYLYASEDTRVAKAVLHKKGRSLDKDNGICIGYIAYSKKAKDIVVAWRGTGRVYEWLQDAEVEQTQYESAAKTYTPNQQAPQAVPRSQNLVPESLKPAVKVLLGFVAGVGATVYGVVPAALVFAAGSFLFGLLDGDMMFAATFTALYAAIASLPIFRKLLGKETAARFTDFPFASLPPAGNFAVVYGGAVGISAVLANYVAVTPERFPFSLFEGSYWGVNALLVGLSAMLPLGITAGKAAYEAALEKSRVHEGFWNFYRNVTQSKEDPAAEPKTSARDTLLSQITTLIGQHESDHGQDDHNLTISVTGHSLGGALATLSAFDIVESNYNVYTDGSRVTVRAFTFEAPRVGNPAFVQRFKDHKAHLHMVRVANRPDVVPDVPKAFFLQNVYYIASTLLNWRFGRYLINQAERLEYWLQLPSAYEHPAGEEHLVEHLLESTEVLYLKKMGAFYDISGNIQRLSTYHNLELNLYLLSSGPKAENPVFTRDIALVNKSYDNLDPRVGIAPNWLETMSPDARKADGGQPVTKAAMIEPYWPDDQGNRWENGRDVGFWVPDSDPDSDSDPDKKPVPKPLRKDVPDFDAAESGVKVQKAKTGTR